MACGEVRETADKNPEKPFGCGGRIVIYQEKFQIEAGDFASAGEVSATIKQKLKKIGIDQSLVRRIAIASYEAELNMIIHSLGGEMVLTLDTDNILLVCQDIGPGIPDIGLAMKEGYSTAPESIRMMGFGAGMGLPNISKHSDDLQIQSDSSGTRIEMSFHIAS